jgi:hypothetical protein|tara:strand:- start:79 stop:303 length:225 start_codon:yes stop_codon:yes gene_type:complete
MELYGSFEEKGYKIEAYLPSNKEDSCEWVIRAYKDKEIVKEVNVPLFHPPIFGPDVEDVATLEDKTEELLNSLE